MKTTGKRSADYETLEDGSVLGLRHGDGKLVAMPDALTEAKRWTPPPVKEQRKAALPVLQKTRSMFKAGMPLLPALAEAGGARIESEYARRALREVTGEWNLMSWADHFRRTRHDVFRALDRAIALCKASVHRGGWRVFSGGEAA